MNVSTAKLVCFSPTQTTRRVIEQIAQGLDVDAVDYVDLTPPAAKIQVFEEMYDELAVIGAPVYSGRIPIDAVNRLRRLKGNDTPAVIVAVYGNREYEDALLELKDLVVELGFKPIAGGTFVGEHSFSTDATPLAQGRPDTEDLQKAAEFGKMIREKLRAIPSPDEISPLQVPGKLPYRERGERSKISPITLENLCERCETCAAVCPTAAITIRSAVDTDQDACILCCACVKNCPTGARVMQDARIQKTVEWLAENCRARKEAEIYL